MYRRGTCPGPIFGRFPVRPDAHTPRFALVAALALVGALAAAPAALGATSPASGPVAGGTKVTVPVPAPDSFLSVSADYNFSLGIDANGDIWSWGSDTYGQLGNGATTGNVTSPTKITSGTFFTSVAAGYETAAAIDADGNLWVWGRDSYGIGGNGSAASSNVTLPAQITSGTVFTTVVAGEYHMVALDAAGNIWSWGYNDSGELGNGAASADVFSPTQATSGTVYVGLGAGEEFTVALDADGHLWGWGSNDYGQTGTDNAISSDVTAPTMIDTGSTRFSAIDAHWYHSLALDTHGNVWSWGYNGYGAVGNGDTTGSDVSVPTMVTSGHVFTDVSAAGDFSTALDAKGQLYAWGNAVQGQLGNGDTSAATVFSPAVSSTAVRLSSISAGYSYAVGLDANGHIFTWGDESYGRLGNGSTSGVVDIPTRIATSNTLVFSAISGGQATVAAIDDEGNLWGWGSNLNGEAGIGSTGSDVTAPTRLTSDTVFVAVAAGISFEVALDSDGHLWTWGSAANYQLGNGLLGDVVVPTILDTGSARFSAIAAGTGSAMALDVHGVIWTWGDDVSGQGGNGAATAAIPVPTQVDTGATTFDQIAAGGQFDLALDSDGNVWAWGNNYNGQVGNGDTSGAVVDTPVQVTSGETFSAIAGGGQHSLAIDSAGNIWGWGYNDYGALGNGDTTGARLWAPAQSTTGTVYTMVEGGNDHSLAIDADGNVWGFGYDQYGVGTPSTTDEEIYDATQVTSGSVFTTITAASDYSLALDNAHNLWSWGAPGHYTLGNGNASARVPEPTRIGSETTITAISFDGVPGTSLTRLSSTRASVVTPAGTAGAADVTVDYSFNGTARPTLTLDDPFTYRAASSNTGSGTSSNGGTASATSATDIAPSFVLQPADVTVSVGDTATFIVSIDADPQPTLQWQVSTDGGVTWADLEAETGDTLTLVASADLDGVQYRVVATNDAGTETSDAATLIVTGGAVITETAPTPTPTSTTADTGGADSGSWVGWVVGGLIVLIILVGGVVIIVRIRA
jgi:alpha-tubulin suppressor-like RCC1 family protein